MRLGLLALFGSQVYTFVNYPSLTATPAGSSYSLAIFLVFFAITGYNLFIHYTAWEKGWWTLRQRIYQTLLAVSLAGFICFLYYWNIGGMLG